MQDLSKLEVLAPAGDIESFKTAINNGADAIYLGLGSFNARLKANNINIQNLRECIKLAHLFGVKVYLTVNTLVKDEELKDFIDLIKVAVESKVDVYIVQDLGVAEILKNNFEKLVLHASTQMGIHNLKGAKIAESLGFTRVVVSRETKLEDIIEIKNNTNLEIEYFVQGALCVAFSGNCYLSSVLSNKSGNRDECLQLCRLPYVAQIGNKEVDNGYLLSPADLCLISKLKTLVDAGVTSFKIEGRLRRPGYVARVVSSYRKAIDNLNSTINLDNEINNLSKVFNRGKYNFGNYLELGVPDKIINKKYNNHIGKKIGRVEKVKPFKDLFEIEISSNEPINANDGLKFFRNGKEVSSLGVGNVNLKNKNYVIYTKQKVNTLDEVYKTLDYNFEQETLNKIKKLNVNVSVEAYVNTPLKITLNYNQNGNIIKVESESCEVCEQPLTKAITKEELVLQINKTNDTYFIFDNVKVSTNGIFLSKSIINKTRRDVVKKLEEAIITDFENDIKGKFVTYDIIKANNNKSIQNNIFVISKIEDLSKIEIKNEDIVCISPEEYSLNNLKEITTKLIERDIKNIALNLPIVCNSKDLKLIEHILKNVKFDYLIVNNIWGLSYVNSHKIIAGIGLNVFSENLKSALIKIGVESVIKSIESISSNIKNSYIYSYGNFSLMTFCHCPYKTINSNTCDNCTFKNGLVYKDLKERKFKIRRYKVSQCYFELLTNQTIDKNISKGKYIDLRRL